jgi:cyanate permease
VHGGSKPPCALLPLSGANFPSMKLTRYIRLLFTFYRYFLWVSVFIDAACAYILWQHGISVYKALFWLKLFSMGASFYLVNEYRKQEYFYFYNFGFSKKSLWIITLAFDLLLFFGLMILAYQFR